MNLVTIGIPFFNNEKTLAFAIRSTIQQSYTNLEIILVDDGSADESLKIAQEFAQKDSRIKVISDHKNKGLISRLNQIIEIAQGHYLARMDADDIMARERIEKQVDLLEKHSHIELVSTGLISITRNLEPIGKRYCTQTVPVIFEVFKNGHNILHPSIMARTSWFRANKYRNGFERAEDRELFTRTIRSSNFHNIAEPLMYYMDVQNMTLPKYLKSYQSERKAYLANWKGKISFFTMIKLYLRSLAKSLTIRIYFLMGREDTLFIRKTMTLTEDELSKYRKDVNSIRS